MTYFLLVILGIVWWFLVRTIGSYFAHKLTNNKAQKLLLSGIIALGIIPPAHELYVYHRFKCHCEEAARYTVNTPVKTDTILFEGDDQVLHSVFASPKIANVVFRWWAIDKQRQSLMYLVDPDEMYIRLDGCIEKGLTRDEKGVPTSFLAYTLEYENICLRPYQSVVQPRYKVEQVSFDDGFFERFWDGSRSTDFAFRLRDTLTGEMISEYRSISAPHGMFLSFIAQWGWYRYSCNPEIMDIFSVPYYRNRHLEMFLDRALL